MSDFNYTHGDTPSVSCNEDASSTFLRKESETPSILETKFAEVAYTKTKAETPSTVDGCGIEVTYTKTKAETPSTVETYDISSTFIRKRSDTLSILETNDVSSSINRHSLSELSASDSNDALSIYSRSNSDVVSPSETKFYLKTYFKNNSDVVSPSETKFYLKTYFRNKQDTPSSLDSSDASSNFCVSNTSIISALDSSCKTAYYEKNKDETASISETKFYLKTYFRESDNTSSVLDSQEKVSCYFKLSSDTASVLDTKFYLKTYLREKHDTISVLDGLIKVGDYQRDVSEPLTIYEICFSGSRYVKSDSIDLSTSETTLKEADYHKISSESPSYLDDAFYRRVHFRVKDDLPVVSSNAFYLQLHYRYGSSTASTSEVAIKSTGYFKSKSENLRNIVEENLLNSNQARRSEETVPIREDLYDERWWRVVHSQRFNDDELEDVAVDTGTKAKGYYCKIQREYSVPIVDSDHYRETVTSRRHYENEALWDIYQDCSSSIERSNDDSVEITDSQVKQICLYRSESVSTVDTLEKQVNYEISFLQGMDLVENHDASSSYARSHDSATLGIKETHFSQKIKCRKTNDEVGTVETFRMPYQGNQERPNHDTAWTSEDYLRSCNHVRSASDNSAADDSFQVEFSYCRLNNENIATTESQLIRKTRYYFCSDETYEVNDFGPRTVDHARDENETLSSSCTYTAKVDSHRICQEEDTTVDQLNVEINYVRSISSSCSVSDGFYRNAQYQKLTSESISTDDLGVTFYAKGLISTEVVSTADSLLKNTTSQRHENENPSISDSRTPIKNYILEKTEIINALDTTRLPYHGSKDFHNEDAVSVAETRIKQSSFFKLENLSLLTNDDIILNQHFYYHCDNPSMLEQKDVEVVYSRASSDIVEAIDTRSLNSRLSSKEEKPVISDFASCEVPTNLSVNAWIEGNSLTVYAAILDNSYEIKTPPSDCYLEVQIGNDQSILLYPSDATNEGIWEANQIVNKYSDLAVRVSIYGGCRVGSKTVSPKKLF